MVGLDAIYENLEQRNITDQLTLEAVDRIVAKSVDRLRIGRLDLADKWKLID